MRRAHRGAPRAVGVVAAAGARGFLSAQLPCARGEAAPVCRAVDDRAVDRRRGRAPRRDQGRVGGDRGCGVAGRAGASAGGLHLGGGRAARRRHRDRARRLQQHAGGGRRPRAAAAGTRQAGDPRPAADDVGRSRRHRGVRRRRVRAVSDDARLRRGRALPRRARLRSDPGAGHRPGPGARGVAGRLPRWRRRIESGPPHHRRRGSLRARDRGGEPNGGRGRARLRHRHRQRAGRADPRRRRRIPARSQRRDHPVAAGRAHAAADRARDRRPLRALGHRGSRSRADLRRRHQGLTRGARDRGASTPALGGPLPVAARSGARWL